MEPTLVGPHVLLRPIVPADFEYLYELGVAPGYDEPSAVSGSTPNPETYHRSLFENVTATFLVVARDSRRRLGIVSCYSADFRNQIAYIAALADGSEPGLSILAIEGVALLVDYCFAMWNFRKLYFESPEFALSSFCSAGNFLLVEEGLGYASTTTSKTVSLIA